jgi:outer membrane protein assembly factor BamD
MIDRKGHSGVNRMKIRYICAPILFAAGLSGCSSISMPSLPWSSTKSDPTAESLLEEGNRNFKDKRYVRAIDNFSKIRTDHPFSPLMTEVELKIADAYYHNQQYPEAIAAFKEFQSMHPTNEHIPFVVLRLGQSYFDQFTSTDRDQKNTEIAKGYFENVITHYPKSPHAAEAREKLAKCLDYLAEHEFNIAHFYFREEKYPAARDRFEEIVRKYKDTPTAVKSLFFLGESYRNEKNAVRATLAYEALLQHYPQSKFASDARTQLARVEKEKHDPLALLLMRDRRPAVAAAPEVKPDPALAKLQNLNLVAKTEVVHENPGDEKGFFRRVADKLNPFSSSDNGKAEQKSETAVELLAGRNNNKEEQSGGLLSSLWPFGSKQEKATPAKSDSKNSGPLVTNIDESLKQKGIDASTRQAALKPPAADLPNTDDLAKGPHAKTDTAALLSSIDSNLKNSGMSPTALPPPPEAAAAFKDVAATQARVAKPAQSEQPPQDIQTSGILSSIDQKLKAKGVEPGQFEKPPTAEEAKVTSAPKPKTRNVEIEPKLALEKGPLFLSPAEVPAQDKPAASADSKKPEESDRAKEPPSRVLVKGPVQPAAVPTKPAATKAPFSVEEDGAKGVVDQIRQDMEGIGKALNPFSW